MRRPELARPAALGAAALVVTAVGLSQAVPSQAAVTSIPADGPASSQAAVALLQRAYHAETTLTYHGRAFVGVDGVFTEATVSHVAGQGTYIVPQGGGGSPLFEPDGTDADPLRMLQAHYAVLLGTDDSRAGRPSWVVRAVRPDGSDAARFWIDKSTSLVLARVAYDSHARPYQQMEFTEIDVGDAGAVQAQSRGRVLDVQPTSAEAPPTHVLVDHGWQVTSSLPGGFELYDAREVGHGAGTVLHLSYSDGLCTMSVFEERGHLAARALTGWHRAAVAGRSVYVDDASPQRLAWQGKGMVFALMSDAAPQRVAAAVAALPHGSVDTGVLDRLGRGFDRLGSWLDPFH